MYTVNALKIRQSLGKVLKELQKKGEPILIEKGRVPVGVLVPLKFFQERFIDYQENKKKEAILNLAKESASVPDNDSLTILRELRYGSGD
jgi:antitoxin (DNA-binding transcriptional repressor) of toxin-antitoxin stability system